MQRNSIVDPVAHVRDIDTGAARDLHDPRLLFGADPGEHGGVWDRGGERVVVERIDFDTGEYGFDVEADVLADLAGDGAVVAGDDLHRDADPVELRDRFAGVGLGPVDERQEAGETQVSFVCCSRLGETVGVAGRDRDDARSFSEQRLQRGVRLGGDVDASGEQCFWCSFGDQDGSSFGGSDDDGGELAFVVEGEQPEAFVAGWWIRAGHDPGGGWPGPQGVVERVAPDGSGGGERGFVAHQSVAERVVGWLAGRVEAAVERDRPFGEGAGLVREQHLDVAEILDRDQSFDQHPLAGELS